MDKLFYILGGILGGLAVALGAFGAHGLRARLAADLLATFETGVRYHMYHALALFAVAAAISKWPGSNLPVVAGWLFVAGQFCFPAVCICWPSPACAGWEPSRRLAAWHFWRGGRV